ncbi:hypothetical protein AK812_SmicGene21165 [Symbiodinium microadriaticum]|uniref:Uncharacterized protein n=1 Tax=Symbiodinium microadriaticum TaxID=2951 RepID=A0A1Q9DN47_SYMMI|nr:hypothetical protein AK812_SmicGene21165 [Symbiodinium microadriaticum]
MFHVQNTAFALALTGLAFWPENVVKEMNEELKGHAAHLHTARGMSNTHMWNASTMADFLPFLAVELRTRRLALKLRMADSKALFLADKAAVHCSPTFRRLRERFEQEHNCILVCREDLVGTVEIPGGWGACGAPNDGFHQHFHSLRRAYMRAAIGQGACSKTRGG